MSKYTGLVGERKGRLHIRVKISKSKNSIIKCIKKKKSEENVETIKK